MKHAMDRVSRISDDAFRSCRDRKLAQDLRRRRQFRDSPNAYVVRVFIHHAPLPFLAGKNHDTPSIGIAATHPRRHKTTAEEID